MLIKKGTKDINSLGKNKKAILEIDFDNYTLYVFQGEFSKFDILIKYKKANLRLRTPKHIHWAVDVLIKMQGQKRLVNKFLIKVKDVWNDCAPLPDNDYETLRSLIENNIEKIGLDEYKKLNKYGEYPVDFLFVLMLLLSLQEKTNRPDAYMFGNILDELLETDYDIFKVVSTAGFSGR